MRVRQLYFGAYAKKSSGAQVRPFVCLSPEEVPERCLEVQSGVLPRSEADLKAEEIAKRHKEERPQKSCTKIEPEVPDLHPGRVAMHNDGVRSHLAIIVEVGTEYTKALFFTSNPDWGQGRARRAKVEELAFTGFISTRRTYLMGVTRRTYDFSPMDACIPDVSNYVRDFEFT